MSACIYLGDVIGDPQYDHLIFKTAIWDDFDIVKGTIKVQFDDVKLAEAFKWTELPVCDVKLEHIVPWDWDDDCSDQNRS